MSEKLTDTLPVFLVGAPLSFLTPIWALPTLLAGVVQGYVLEEWMHHSVLFYDFKNPYFRYMRRHHRYHHSPRGSTLGFGLTSGIWDVVFKTRYPRSVRKELHVPSSSKAAAVSTRSDRAVGDLGALTANAAPPPLVARRRLVLTPAPKPDRRSRYTPQNYGVDLTNLPPSSFERVVGCEVNRWRGVLLQTLTTVPLGDVIHRFFHKALTPGPESRAATTQTVRGASAPNPSPRMERRRERLILLACGVFLLSLDAAPAPRPSLPAAAQVPPRKMSLQQVVEYALEHSPLLIASRSRVTAAEGELRGARGERLPQIGLVGSYGGFYPEERRVVPGARLESLGGPSAPQGIEPWFAHNIWMGGVGVSVPLYTGGILSARVRLERFAVELEQQLLSQSREDLALNVTSLFHTILRLRETLAAVEGSLESLRESQRVIGDFVDVGQLPEVELFKIQTRLAEVERRFIAVDNAHRVAQTSLGVIMGIDDPAFTLDTDETLVYEPTPRKLDESIDAARRQRPALLAKERAVRIQEELLEMARGKLHPQVNLSAIYSGTVADEGQKIDMGAVQVGVSFPLFEWGAIRGRIAAEKARLDSERQEYEALRLDVALEVQTALLNLLEAEKRLASAEASLREAQEVLRIEQMRLQEGEGIAQDVLDAQAAELRGEEDVFAATADARIERAALDRAIGTLTRSVRAQP